MYSEAQCVVDENKVQKAEHILASLRYLYNNCPSLEQQNLIKTALDLCYSALLLDTGKINISNTEGETLSTNFIASLEYLKNEASRGMLDEMEMILEATFKLSYTMYYLQLHGAYRPIPLRIN